uniref:Ig-like domain-containing protein n=1 Tax=Nothobranchius furzeri TaxID=105023 RepID=A0A8C6LQC8_NOTFU
ILLQCCVTLTSETCYFTSFCFSLTALVSARTQKDLTGIVAEGTGISLSCEYDGSIYSIQWYRHQQKSRPEFLLYITEGGSIYPIRSDFSARINKTQKRVDLLISSAAATDSAVYYCALQPTVTGNSKSV